jgi:hypothetical protein
MFKKAIAVYAGAFVTVAILAKGAIAGHRTPRLGFFQARSSLWRSACR